MATHSSVLAWRIPGTEEPGELPSMGLTELDTTDMTQQQQQQQHTHLSQSVHLFPYFDTACSQTPYTHTNTLAQCL